MSTKWRVFDLFNIDNTNELKTKWRIFDVFNTDNTNELKTNFTLGYQQFIFIYLCVTNLCFLSKPNLSRIPVSKPIWWALRIIPTAKRLPFKGYKVSMAPICYHSVFIPYARGTTILKIIMYLQRFVRESQQILGQIKIF